MSEAVSNKEREFFVTGAKTYLDVDDAMAQFRRRIQDQVTKLVDRRLDEINRACETDWTANDLRDYTERLSDCFCVGKQVALENFGALYFYLRICREDANLAYTTIVDLYRQRANLAIGLWDFGTISNTASCKGNDIFFPQRLLSEEQVLNFPEHLNSALDNFITFIRGCGGLSKYLPKKPPSGGTL
jgi:hypothetical protein